MHGNAARRLFWRRLAGLILHRPRSGPCAFRPCPGKRSTRPDLVQMGAARCMKSRLVDRFRFSGRKATSLSAARERFQEDCTASFVTRLSAMSQSRAMLQNGTGPGCLLQTKRCRMRNGNQRPFHWSSVPLCPIRALRLSSWVVRFGWTCRRVHHPSSDRCRGHPDRHRVHPALSRPCPCRSRNPTWMP